MANADAALHKEPAEEAERGCDSVAAAAPAMTMAVSVGRASQLLRRDSQPRFASVRYQLEHQLKEPTGDWKTAAYLVGTTTAGPPLLTLSFALACLGWVGGLVTLIFSSAAAAYCCCLLVQLHEYGGKRLTRYRDMTAAILGPRVPWAPAFFSALQFVLVVGVGWAQVILGGQLLQQVCTLYSGEGGCSTSLSIWIVVAGAALALLSQFPDMGSIGWLAAGATALLVTYSGIAVVLAGIDGSKNHSAGAVDYSIPGGSAADRVLTGFNALGILVFAQGTCIIPEIHATVGVDPRSGSSRRRMMKGLLIASALIFCIYLTTAVVGYWAYSNSVSSFLLFMPTSPRWLVTLALLLVVVQNLVLIQAYSYLVYEALELALLGWFPSVGWIQVTKRNQQGRLVTVPSLWLVLVERTLYVAFLTFLAATFPFFSDIMGAVGALGFTPMTYVLPLVLYLVARGPSLPAWAWWGNAGLAAALTLAGLAAAVGSIRLIVENIRTYQFYS